MHLATASSGNLYAPPTNITSYDVMAPTSVGNTGGGGPHNNMMPTLVMSYAIATSGVFPSP